MTLGRLSLSAVQVQITRVILQRSTALAKAVMVSSCAISRRVSSYLHLLTPYSLHSQINGNRAGAPPTESGANIEMGGANSNQLIEYVHSYYPPSWSFPPPATGFLSF